MAAIIPARAGAFAKTLVPGSRVSGAGAFLSARAAREEKNEPRALGGAGLTRAREARSCAERYAWQLS